MRIEKTRESPPATTKQRNSALSSAMSSLSKGESLKIVCDDAVEAKHVIASARRLAKSSLTDNYTCVQRSTTIWVTRRWVSRESKEGVGVVHSRDDARP